nr:methyl-CpG-binding domain-containing protein 7-like isoform X2 [Tanacetum cinerariifolium]
MCTYLKNMENYKHNQSKNKSIKEIQMLFNNIMKWIEAFVPMDTELVKGSKEAVEGSEKAITGSKKAQEGSSKRSSDRLEQEDAMRQRIEEENKSAELKRCLEIFPEDDDDVRIEAIHLSSKSPTIVDYKIYKEGRKSFFKIIRADIEKMYLFTRNILQQMWNDVRLHVDYEVERAYDLLRLIRSMALNKKGNMTYYRNQAIDYQGAMDDAWHDKAIVFKVKGLEAVDQAMEQLARLLNEDDSSSFSKPPSKNNWVIGSSPGEKWHAFADDTFVPDSTKQQ